MTSNFTDLERHPAILSLRRDGFLSEAIDYMVPTLRTDHAAWFDFAERVNRLGQHIMNAAEADCIGRTTHDPVELGIRLLIRSLSGFQAAVLLAERGMGIEAQTLVRGLYENALWLGYLVRTPIEAVEALLADELRSQRGRDKAILDGFARAGASDPILQGQLVARVAAVDQELKGKPRRLRIEELAAKGDFEDFYMFYKQLSSGSAHPSFHSLSKHLNMNDDGTWSGHITGPDREGLEQALILGTHALLTNLAALNAIWPHAADAGEVQTLQEEHVMLNGLQSPARTEPA